jgi:ATP-binding cassette, subfamily F, member 3
MQILHVNKVTVNRAGHLVFRDLNWTLNDRDRVGLVGPNGAGKSSLLKAITGEISLDAGVVSRARGARVGYLPQEARAMPGQTVLQAALTLPPELALVEAELNAVEARLADPAVYNHPTALERQLAAQEKVLAKYEALGGLSYENNVRGLLTQFGFTADDLDLPTEVLSGGQKKLLALARLAAESPELLLLDEPDNHLDLEAKHRLETFIQAYSGAVIIVSHDRYLLDEAVTQIAELDNGELSLYTGNYSAYMIERELRRLRQQQMYVAQQKRITQIEEAIKRFDLAARADLNERHARQAASRRKMLARMEASGEMVERVTERRALNLQLDGWRGSTKVLEIKKLAMAFDDNLLFYDLDLLIRHGERVGLIGPNGTGKSVLFGLIRGEWQPLDGEIKLGPSVRVGHYAQEHQTLASWAARTPVEFIRDVRPCPEGEAVSILLKFLFTYEQARQPIGTLSGGERSRLQLVAIMLSNPNLLLLDEPTNNLDIPSSEALETALDPFEGSVLVISHDRYFLDRVVDRVVELRDGKLYSYDGGYSEYLDYLSRKPVRRA